MSVSDEKVDEKVEMETETPTIEVIKVYAQNGDWDGFFKRLSHFNSND
jgi:hypothetical protein